jgi:predicted DNA-binding protein (MmcQ/YjbR family)
MAPAIRTVRAKLRDFALALPETHEDLPWGERVVKVKNKVFVFLGRDMDTEHFGISVKLPTSRLSALRLPFTEPTGYGLGKSGWVSAKLDDKSQASFEMLRDWVTESYCAVAPKALGDAIGSAKAEKKANAKAKARAGQARASGGASLSAQRAVKKRTKQKR